MADVLFDRHRVPGDLSGCAGKRDVDLNIARAPLHLVNPALGTAAGCVQLCRRGREIPVELRVTIVSYAGLAEVEELLVTGSERFGGLISLNGAIPREDCPLLRLPEVRQLRVLIGHGIANVCVPLTMAQADFRLLYTAGLDVTMQTYAATHRLHVDMLKDVNRWIIDSISEQESPEEDSDE